MTDVIRVASIVASRVVRVLSGVACVVVPVAALPAGPASAQSQASTQVRATVVGSNLQITPMRDLSFGGVLAGGGVYEVTVTSAQAGKWRVQGTAGAEVSLGLILPSQLLDGGASLPISYSDYHAAYFAWDVPALATTFDPNDVVTTRLFGFFGGNLYVWVGGSIAPPPSQASGDYTAPMTLVVSYTGN